MALTHRQLVIKDTVMIKERCMDPKCYRNLEARKTIIVKVYRRKWAEREREGFLGG